MSSPAGPRATGSGNYCAGPTTAFLTASVVAAPPSATLPFVSSAASSTTSSETGGASTPSFSETASTFSVASVFAAAAA